MTHPARNLSDFTRNLWLTLGVFFLFVLVFAAYVMSEKQIGRANEVRLRSFQLADELRQSSDDLTRMVRSYVITGDPLYKRHFQEILDIRNGLVERPVEYENIYWDLVLADDHRPRPGSGQKISLLELMRQAGFTEPEFAKLAEAKNNSDALTRTEYEAMRLVESNDPPTDTHRLQASRMLHDAAYHQAKAGIMQPIAEFYRMADLRTLEAVRAQEQIASFLRITFLAFGALLIFMILRIYRTLHDTLGGRIDEVYAHIARIGTGEFDTSIAVAEGRKDSVLGWLSETQANLARIHAEHQEAEAKNRRLTRFYNALSECNQAIVRCTHEEELFPLICRDVVSFGGMKMAWIGRVDESEGRIVPSAWYGQGTDYLDGIVISVREDEAAGRGPSGTAAREDRPYWCGDFQTDPATVPWQERGARFGWRASAALPLHKNGKVFGVFTLYSDELDAFDQAARNLLVEMAVDIDYALNGFEREARREEAEASLATSRKLLQTIIDTAPVRIFWKDRQSYYLGCNPAFARDAGVASPDALLGMNDYQLAWRDFADFYRRDDQEVMTSSVPRLGYDEPINTAQGNVFWLRTSKVPLRDENNEIIGVLGVYEDITMQKQTADRLHHLANFDPLTGLPNRMQLNEHLKYALTLAKRNRGYLALMFLDIDHFKDINDTLGHSAGDALLIELAQRIRGVLREEDTVSRLGGDEFIFLLPGTDARGAAKVAQKLLDVISEAYRIEHYDLTLTASIGIAVYPNDGLDMETLSKNADAAMYRVKREGRHGYRFYTQDMQARAVRNLQLVTALRLALETGQLHVVYQPQLAAQDGRLIGAEALLRWQHPELGSVAPSEFIPLAEDSGLIMPIGEWVLRSAVRQASLWLDAGLPPLIMAVNLSMVQFRHPDLPAMVARILEEEGLPPEYLELELTEGIAMHSPLDAIAVLNELHDLGVRLSIDDFGTGYSSLSYLKKFKVYKLKIDQSFVRDINTDPEDKAIVTAIISLAKSLGLKTIAEGVETEGQLQFLREQSCDEVQGYFYSKPLPADEFGVFANRHRYSEEPPCI